MKQFVYIFGPPGSGKTTLMKEVIKRLEAMKVYEASKPVPHIGYITKGKKFAVLGKDKEPFGGTDTLSYTAVGSCAKWLTDLPELVLAEGDRLANLRFFEAVRSHYDLKLFYLNTGDEVARDRRESRAKKHGMKMQSASWVKGRSTKHRNLAVNSKGVVTLSGESKTAELANSVLDCIVIKTM